MASNDNHWHLKLFRTSVIKQAKWRQIHRLVGVMDGRCGLDLGSDNGVISLLLRGLGGTWHSADLNATTVESIRALVGERVFQTDGRSLALNDESIDVVVIVDMLEHLQDDRSLVKEIARVLRPGGKLIVNVPHDKPHALLRPLRLALGLTDQWHGHVRPGYTRASLDALLSGEFSVVSRRTYNRFFSEVLDILLNYLYGKKRKATATDSTKGTVVTRDDLKKQEKAFRLYSMVYPLMRAFAALDCVVWPFSGYSLIVSTIKSCDRKD